MRVLNKLSARKVETIKEPGRYGDGGGLWLQVTEARTKSWLFRFMRDGVAREMGLGALHTLPLADARQRATECRRQLLDGLDPIEHRETQRKAVKATAAKRKTFRQCAEEWLADNKGEWKNPKHRQQWVNTLASYVYPVIGDLSVADIDTDLVAKVLRPIWNDIPETARRVRMRIERVMSYAITLAAHPGPNPAAWDDCLENILPNNRGQKQHQPALPFVELPGFMTELRQRDSISARALEFAILTAMRTTEVVGATWDEIDLDRKSWNLSAERMKADRGHSVPLSDRAIELLKSLPREKGNPFVFIGAKTGYGLSGAAMAELLKGMQAEQPGRWVDPQQGDRPIVPHGFRSTFSDWTSERTAYSRDVREMALAHAVKDKTEEAYRRGDLFQKRARLMADWADFTSSPPAAAAGNVVAMQAGAA